MKDTIRQIVLSGGTVTWPFKRGLKHWYGQIDITHSLMFGVYFVKCDGGLERFDDIEEALNYFGVHAFNKKNVAIGLMGAIKHKLLSDEEIDELDHVPPIRIKDAVREYYKKFYDQEYPFAGEFAGSFER